MLPRGLESRERNVYLSFYTPNYLFTAGELRRGIPCGCPRAEFTRKEGRLHRKDK